MKHHRCCIVALRHDYPPTLSYHCRIAAATAAAAAVAAVAVNGIAAPYNIAVDVNLLTLTGLAYITSHHIQKLATARERHR